MNVRQIFQSADELADKTSGKLENLPHVQLKTYVISKKENSIRKFALAAV